MLLIRARIGAIRVLVRGAGGNGANRQGTKDAKIGEETNFSVFLALLAPWRFLDPGRRTRRAERRYKNSLRLTSRNHSARFWAKSHFFMEAHPADHNER
jgi:hypothetical protein